MIVIINSYVEKFENILIKQSDPQIYYPLSIEQESLWLEDSVRNENAKDTHVEAISFRIKGNTDLVFIQEVFFALLKKHPVLKCTFEVKDGIVVQMINSCKNRVDDYGSFYDLCGKSQNEISMIERNLYKKRVSISDKISNFVLLKYKENEFRVFIFVHHLVVDSSSLNKIVSEMFLLVEEYAKTGTFKHQVINRDAKQVLMTRDKQTNSSLEKKYWKKIFKKEIPLLQLPQDFSPAKGDVNSSKMLTSNISHQYYEQLKLFCTTNDVTPFTLLNCIYALLIHKLSQSTTIPISVGMNTRPFNRENEIGYFVNALPCIYEIDTNQSIYELLQEMKKINKTVSGLRNYPFSEVNRLFEYDRSQKFHPLLQFGSTGIKYENISKQIGNNIYTYEHVRTDSQGDSNLSMFFADDGKAFNIELIYKDTLYKESTAKKMLEGYFSLLEQVINKPHSVIKELTILSELEKEEQLIKFNQTKMQYTNTKTIHKLFEDQVKKSPNNIAVTDKNSSLTYTELNERSNQLAHYLISKGILIEDLVAISVERSLEMLIAVLAVLKVGGAYVPIDPSHPHDRINYTLQDSNPKMILTQSSLGNKVSGNTDDIVNIDLLDLSTFEKINPNIDAKSDNLAYVMYTSGTTGQPKGVMIEHKSVLNHLQWMEEEFPIDKNDNVLQKTPLGFDVSVWEFFAPILYGAQLHIVLKDGHKDIEYLIDTIIKYNITIIQIVPSVLSICCSMEKFRDCSSLRSIFCGGEPLSLPLLKTIKTTLPSTKLYNMYGPTETCIDASFFDCSDYALDIAPPIGKPIGNVKLYILDKDNNLIQKGMAGELYIAGDGLARGYLNQDQLTKEKFIKNPFSDNIKMYKTGDLVKYLDDGNIEYLGRIDNQVKIRGLRVELGEIEKQLSNLTSIKESTVITVDEKNQEKSIVAFITIQDNAVLNTIEIKERLKKYLPDYMIPKAIIKLDSMPLTLNGKVNKQVLLKHDIPLVKSKEYIAPRDEIEKRIEMIFSDVLGIEKIGVYDNFFELGGHSLIAVTLLSRINKSFKLSLPLKTVFQAPTIVKLKKVIEEDLSPSDILIPIQRQGERNAIFAVPGIGGTGLEFELLSRRLGDSQPFYTLQSVGLDGTTPLLSSVEAIAQANVKAMKKQQPEGPYNIIGFSFGGLVAFEMARILGKELNAIIMLDTLLDGKNNIWSLFLLYIKKIDVIFLFKHYLDLLLKKKNERTLLMKKVINNNYICEKKYKVVPLKQKSKIILVCAEENEITNIEVAWNTQNINNLSVYKLKGGHLDILNEKGVERLSQVINECFFN